MYRSFLFFRFSERNENSTNITINIRNKICDDANW